MKRKYNNPEVEIICFETEDVITNSGGSVIPGGDSSGNTDDGWS